MKVYCYAMQLVARGTNVHLIPTGMVPAKDEASAIEAATKSTLDSVRAQYPLLDWVVNGVTVSHISKSLLLSLAAQSEE